MKFTKLGENEIRCILSEEEMFSFGIDLDDILEKNVKSGRFFNEILSQAVIALGEEDAFRIRGCSAQINVMKDRSISILFHTRKDDSLSERFKNPFEADRISRHALKSQEKSADSNSLLISFKTMDDAVAFCKSMKDGGHIVSRFYKNNKNGEFVLFMLGYACDEDLFKKLKVRAHEFGRVNPDMTASKIHIMDNSELLIEDDAFFSLSKL